MTAESKAESCMKFVNSVECSICFEQFKNPKFLPCDHTFCLECLVKCGRDKRTGEEMLCPICRQKFRIPSEGFNKLPCNYFVQKVLDNLQKLLTCVIKCDLCCELDSNDVASFAATGYCAECEQYLCTACVTRHKKQRSMQDHKVLLNAEEKAAKNVTKLNRNFCEKHLNKMRELFCCDCKLTVCLLCYVAKHNGHKCSDVTESTLKFTALLEEGIKKMNEYLEVMEKKLIKMNEDKEGLLQRVSYNEQLIVDQCNNLRRHINLQEAALLEKLNKFKTDELNTEKIKRNKYEQQRNSMKSIKSSALALTTKGSPDEMLHGAGDLLARMEQIFIEQAALNKDSSPVMIKVVFTANPLPDSRHNNGPGFVGQLCFLNETAKKEHILIILGMRLENGSNTLQQKIAHVNLARPNCIRTIDDTPTEISPYAVACTLGNTVYIIGAGRKHNQLWKWNTFYDWMRCEDMPSDRYGHCAAALDSTIYAFGGASERLQSAVQRDILAFNAHNNEWIAHGQLNTAVSDAACIAYRDLIYIIAGTGASWRKDNKLLIQVYDPVQQQCTLMANNNLLAGKRINAVLWETNAILMNHNTCLVYNFETQAWSNRDQYVGQLSNRAAFGLVCDNQTLYVVGGLLDGSRKKRPTPSDAIDSIPVRDVISGHYNRWQHHATLPQPATVHAYTVVESVTLLS